MDSEVYQNRFALSVQKSFLWKSNLTYDYLGADLPGLCAPMEVLSRCPLASDMTLSESSSIKHFVD